MARRVASFAASVLLAAGCGDIIAPATSTVVLRGVAASGSFSGSVELNIAISDENFQRSSIETAVLANGTLTPVGGASIVFTGTYQTKTRVVTAEGGGYTLSIRVPGGAFLGGFSTSGDSGQAAGISTWQMNTNNGFTRSPVGIKTLCGSYDRGVDRGKVNLTVSSTTGVVVGVVVDGSGRTMRLDGTMDPTGQMTGTFVAPDGLSNIRARLTAGSVDGFMSGPAGAGAMGAATC